MVPTWPAMNRPGVPPAIFAESERAADVDHARHDLADVGRGAEHRHGVEVARDVDLAVVVIEPSGPTVSEPRLPG